METVTLMVELAEPPPADPDEEDDAPADWDPDAEPDAVAPVFEVEDEPVPCETTSPFPPDERVTVPSTVASLLSGRVGTAPEVRGNDGESRPA
jgi:hypothetical protein